MQAPLGQPPGLVAASELLEPDGPREVWLQQDLLSYGAPGRVLLAHGGAHANAGDAFEVHTVQRGRNGDLRVVGRPARGNDQLDERQGKVTTEAGFDPFATLKRDAGAPEGFGIA